MRVPYNQNKIRREIVVLGGINWSDNYQDGDLAECRNISASRFPYITTAKKDIEMSGTGYEDVEAITSQQNLISFANNKVYLDGNEFCNMPTGAKRTAFVNSQMFVLPDEKLINIYTKYDINSAIVSDSARLEKWFNDNGAYAVGTHYFLPPAWTEKIETAPTVYASAPAYKDHEETEYTYYYDSGIVKANYTDYHDGAYYKSTPIEVNMPSASEEDTDIEVFKAADALSIYQYGGTFASVPAGVYFGLKHTSLHNNVYYWQAPITDGGDNGGESGFYYYSIPENSLNGEHSFNISELAVEAYGNITVTASEATIKSVMSITAKATAHEGDGYKYGIFDRDLSDLLAVDDTVTVTYGSSQFVGTVKSLGDSGQLTNNKISVQNAQNEFLAFGANQWYTFKLLDSPDFACEWNNRLWCCNSAKQLIYGSAQGKPYDFTSDMDSAIGAWQVVTGDPAPFTAMAKFESSLLLFKEDRIYRVLGYSPKNYELHSSEVEGVKMGCDKSIQTVNGVLYFVGRHGVYAYAGGNPVLISAKLGNIEMNNAVGGTDGERYFLSFENEKGKYFMIYEPKYSIWLLKDSKKAADFARKGAETYCLNDDTKKVVKVAQDENVQDLEWHLQYKPFYETVESVKKYSRLFIRYELSKKSKMTVKVRYDGGIWEEAGKIFGKREGVSVLQVPINRCDKFELRIEGVGEATIHEIIREFELGSEVE